MSDILEVSEAKQLRARIRKQRRSLAKYELKAAEHAIVAKIMQLPEIKFKQHIGLYLDAFGEVPTGKIILELLKRKKTVYLPLICNMNQTLHWQPISFHQWRNGRFASHYLGMKQAMHSYGLTIDALDAVLMPLVVFDEKGHRMGMGGGFYDRTLAQAPHHPYRIGLAHDFQKSQKIMTMQPWDQSLDVVCTSTKIWRFKR